jgi:hypothetical protein
MSNKCERMKCEWSRLLKECLVCSSMRLGVHFIAPRQLGAVESNPGRQILPSVDWRTGQSGAPMWPLARPRVTRGILGRPLPRLTVDSPDSPVNHRTDRWILAVRRWWFPESDEFACEWPTGQSSVPLDRPVNFSRTPPSKSREQPVRQSQPGAPDTVRCTQIEQTLAEQSHLISDSIFLVSST